jgi:ubiquinone/menaquinone biosynthesis C-methylase UbiE
MKRIPTTELLDTDEGTPQEVEASLKDLRWFNRWFGGIQTTRRMVEYVAATAGVTSLSLLEVAAGAGFVAHQTRKFLARRGVRLEVTLLDRLASHLGNGGRSVVGDALALPFHESSFDVVSCNLFVHHLSPELVVQFVRECLRVCRKGVLINDLIRHPLHMTLVVAGVPIYRSRITRHDAPASVRQAYTKEEMCEILRNTPAAKVEIGSYYLFRMGVIVWKA